MFAYRVFGNILQSELATLLGRAASLAGATPVYRLGFVRDYDLLDEVAATLARWHDPASTTTAALTPAPTLT